MLDLDSFTPLYIQIAHILEKSILSGEVQPGDRLPSEKELVGTYHISRITATAALDELVKKSLAYRARGRGTFVARKLLSNFSFFSSFSEDMQARGMQPGSRLLSLSKEQPEELFLKKLAMPADQSYYCLTRIRLADNEPVAFQQAFLPTKLYPDLEERYHEHDSLLEIMRNVYAQQPTWSEAVVEAGAATEREARYLEIPPAAPVLIIWHLTLDDHYTSLEYVYSVYRSDRFSFSTGRNPLKTFQAKA